MNPPPRESPSEKPSAAPAGPAESRALGPGELSAYGAGIIAYQCPYVALPQLAMPVFNVALGYAPATVGGVLMLGKFWDAAWSPVMGAMSDRTRTRWGRRRPFILAGGVAMALAYPLVWLAPHLFGSAGQMIYFLLATVLLYTAFCVFSVPYMALGLELSPDYHERTKVQVWRMSFNVLLSFASGWFYWFCQRPAFGGVVAGARWLGLFVGILILVTSVLPALFVRERYYAIAAAARREPIWQSLREVCRNRPFVIIVAVILALELGRFTTDNLGFYVLVYHVYAGNTAAAAWLMGINTTVLLGVSVATILFISRAERRWGKISALRGCLLLNLLADALKPWLASPLHPWTWIVVNALANFGTAGFWILVNSMKADVCDWDELASGRRREGAFSSVASMLQKAAAAVTLLLSGLILGWIGFDAARGSLQSPAFLPWLRFFYSAPSIALLLLCLLLLRRYRLDETTMRDVRHQLERRRATV